MSTGVSTQQSHGSTVVWDQVLALLAKNVDQACFDTWFRPIAFVGCDETTLRLTVPNENFKKWLLENYSNVLDEAIREAVGASIQLHLSVEALAESADPAMRASVVNGLAALPVVRASALETTSNRQPWLVEGLWTAKAVGVIGGPPKCGKSWLALDMAVSVASGSPCLGNFPAHSCGPVLLYAAEDSTTALRVRLETLAQNRSLDFDCLDVRVITAASLRLDRASDQDRLQATVELHQPVLLVLDPLVRLHAIDENAAGEVAALLGYLRALQRKTGVAIALVHHVRKNVSPVGGAGYSLRGSSDLYAWLDSFLYLRKHRDQLTLSAEHRSAPGFGPFALELAQSSSPERGTHLKLVYPAKTDSAPAEDSLLSRILHLLSNSAEPTTVDSLRSSLQVRNQRVVEALRQLSSEGKVMRLARGYALKRISP